MRHSTHVLWAIFHFQVNGDGHFAIWDKVRSSQVKARSFNPRPGGGLSQLRHGGGSKWPPHVTQKLIGLGRHAIRRSIALNNVFQKYIGYFFLRSIFRSPEVRRGQLLLRTVVFFGILAIISETIIDRAKPKKANDSSEEALSPISHQNWAKSHSFGCISQKFQK